MDVNNTKKGLICGVIATICIGFQPIVANARPSVLDPYLFAAMTVFVEALVFFPIMLLERRKIKTEFKKDLISSKESESILYGYKKNIPLLFFVGSIFGIGQILFFIGYSLSGAINGSLAQKSTIFFSLLFGFLILHEKVSWNQIIFSGLLFFGLILAVTEGSFNLLQLNPGVLILLLLSSLWMMAHTFTKPVFDRKEAIPSQMVVIRNGIGFIILISTYFIFFPLENAQLLLDPVNLFWGFAMGAVYGTGLFFWYKTLTYIQIGTATIITSLTPFTTVLFSFIILGDGFTIFHLIGTFIMIFSIVMIVREKEIKLNL